MVLMRLLRLSAGPSLLQNLQTGGRSGGFCADFFYLEVLQEAHSGNVWKSLFWSAPSQT